MAEHSPGTREGSGSLPVDGSTIIMPLHEDVTPGYELGREGSNPSRGTTPPRTDATWVSEAR
jgi:hypothetical protein